MSSYVSEFRGKVGHIFEQSSINKTYKFPREGEEEGRVTRNSRRVRKGEMDDPKSACGSLESLEGVEVYDLYDQNKELPMSPLDSLVELIVELGQVEKERIYHLLG